MKRRFAFPLLALAVTAGCGYRPAYAGPEPDDGLTLHLAANYLAEAEIAHEVVMGARSELARAGAQRIGEGYPRLMVEVLRFDEAPRGIAARPVGAELLPRARATSVGIVGRAWVLEAPNAPRVRDTGDVRRVEAYGVTADPTREALQYDAAARSAARELGHALVQRVLGEPSPTLEPM